jgi:iron complex outermembrane receptor protein
LPGVSPHTVTAGFDWQAKSGPLATLTYYYGDKIPVNDANNAYADAYHLLGAKIGYQHWWGKTVRVKIIAGADNLLDQAYSLGNDINGFGGRYYNPAPGRNYYTAILFNFVRREPKP